MDSTAPKKRFSLSALSRGFSLSLKRSSTSGKEFVGREPCRAQTQSVHGNSLFRNGTSRKSLTNDEAPSTVSDIRNTIRRSLSVILYASPHSEPSSTCSTLVPVLVTQGLLDDQGNTVKMIDDAVSSDKEVTLNSKKARFEYDNTINVLTGSDGKNVTIVWQGYAYTLSGVDIAKAEELKSAFDSEIWTTYQGLVHPLQLFEDTNQSVAELRRYFDNYGSMLLRIRESRMIEQQRHYHGQQTSEKSSEAWMIPDATKVMCAS